MTKNKNPAKNMQQKGQAPSSSEPPLWLTDRDNNTTAPIFFWKPQEAWGFLGQWYPSSFKGCLPEFCHDGPDCMQCEAERKRFSCAEQYMMYHKALTFNDTKTAEQILATNDPKTMKALGRKVHGFTDHVWDNVKFDVVVQASLLKFGVGANCEARADDSFAYGGIGRRHDQDVVRLRKMLLSTGTRDLVEASALDRVWGIGFSPEEAGGHGEEERLKWGKNLLGRALMEARRRIRLEEGLEIE